MYILFLFLVVTLTGFCEYKILFHPVPVALLESRGFFPEPLNLVERRTLVDACTLFYNFLQTNFCDFTEVRFVSKSECWFLFCLRRFVAPHTKGRSGSRPRPSVSPPTRTSVQCRRSMDFGDGRNREKSGQSSTMLRGSQRTLDLRVLRIFERSKYPDLLIFDPKYLTVPNKEPKTNLGTPQM